MRRTIVLLKPGVWIGFTLHAILADIWIHYTRGTPAARITVSPEAISAS